MEITRTYSRDTVKVNMPVKGVEKRQQKESDRQKNTRTGRQDSDKGRRIDDYA